MAGTQTQHLQDNLNIDTHIIHNLAHLLHSNMNRSCFGHLSYDLSQDRQVSGLRPLSRSILASDPTRVVHNKIYSLNRLPEVLSSNAKRVNQDQYPSGYEYYLKDRVGRSGRDLPWAH